MEMCDAESIEAILVVQLRDSRTDRRYTGTTPSTSYLTEYDVHTLIYPMSPPPPGRTDNREIQL